MGVCMPHCTMTNTCVGVQEAFTVQPPLSIFSSCIQDGKLSVRLMKVRIGPLAPPCQVQVIFNLRKEESCIWLYVHCAA